MNNHKPDPAKLLTHGCAIIALFYLLTCLILGLAGCSHHRELHKAEETKKETSSSDSATVRKTNNNTNSIEDWERIIERFAKPTIIAGGDTNIYITQPIERIIERGSRNTTTQANTYDSNAHKRIDVLEQQQQTKQNTTTTKVLTVWHLFAAAVVALIIGMLLSKLKISF